MPSLTEFKKLLSSNFVGSGYRFLMNPSVRAKVYLEASKDNFKKQYDSYWEAISQDRSLTTMQKQFDEIIENGYTVIPGFLSSAQLNSIRSEVWALPGFIDGCYSGDLPFTALPNDGICALGISEKLPQSYRATIGNNELLSLARALFGVQTKLSAASILNKYDRTRVDSAVAPHWDDWRVRLKAFIYLTDVTTDQAPTIYLKGSTANVPWRFEKDFASVYLPNASAGGSWFSVDALGFEKVLFTGSAGTMVIFDARGIHAATHLNKDIRVMLMSMFTTHLDFTHKVF
jgi:hypothetical protein